MSFLVRVLVALAAIAFLISSGPEAYRTAKGWIDDATTEASLSDEVASSQRAKALVAKGQRDQLISFRDELREVAADSAHPYYALGVGQVTLKEPEAIPGAKVSVTGSRSQQRDYTSTAPIGMATDCQNYPVSGRFNNILLFDKQNETFHIVFDKRVAVSSFQASCKASRPVIWVRAVEEDTDGDGSLASGDDEVLYVYALDDKALHRIVLEHMRVLDVQSVPEAGYLLVQCRVDRNRDGKFDYGYGGDEEEPTTIMRVDLKTFAATPFVPAGVVSSLQRVLEGQAIAPPPK